MFENTVLIFRGLNVLQTNSHLPFANDTILSVDALRKITRGGMKIVLRSWRSITSK